MRSLRAAVIAAGLSLVAVSPAAAQWQQLPNGEVAYTLNYSTSGVFACLASRFYREGSCTAAGSSVTITDAAGRTATYSFAGVSETLLVTNSGQPIAFGAFTASAVDGFGLPRLDQPTRAYFTFSGQFAETPALPMSGAWGGAYFSDRGALRASQPSYGYTTYLYSPRLGYGYGLAIEDLDLPTLTPNAGPRLVSGRVSLTPEPATIALLGGGLLALGGMGALRRR